MSVDLGGEGYQFVTRSEKVYTVVANTEGRFDSVMRHPAERLYEVEQLGKATVVFISDDQANTLAHLGNLRRKGYKLRVRAVASEHDGENFGREPIVGGIKDGLQHRHIIERGGAFMLFAEKGQDFSKEKLPIGEVRFEPEVGKRALVIPMAENEDASVTTAIESTGMLSPLARLASMQES